MKNFNQLVKELLENKCLISEKEKDNFTETMQELDCTFLLFSNNFSYKDFSFYIDNENYRYICATKDGNIIFQWDSNIKFLNYLVDSLIPSLNDNTKYLYDVTLMAETESTGQVLLTKKEAKLVQYATNPNNWTHLNAETYSGSFHIDADNPHKTIKEKERV